MADSKTRPKTSKKSKAKTEACRKAGLVGGKRGWSPERRQAQRDRMRRIAEEKKQARLTPPPPDTPEETEADFGLRQCREWLAERGVDVSKESPVVRATDEPPEDPVALVRFRVAVWQRAAIHDQADFRKAILERCVGKGMADADALVYFTKLFVWQNNPALKGKEVGPFVPWPYQIEAARITLEILLGDSEEWEREDLGWEKSRELGATWWMLVLGLKVAVIHRSKRILALSHTEEAVTKAGDEDTLFGKLEFILTRMPDWVKKGAYKRKKGFRFPGTGSQITGAASTIRSGVGGRVTLVLLDEYSKLRDAEEIWAQTASTGPRLFVGTHYGVGTHFYALTQGPNRVRKVVMHWSQHPVFGRGLYRSTENGFEVLDKTFLYPPQCPKCSRLYRGKVGEVTTCCRQPARPFQFVVGGKPFEGARPGLRSPWYDGECVRRGNERVIAQHLDIAPKGSAFQVFDAGTILQLKRKCKPPLWEGDFENGVLVPRPFGPLKLWVHPTVHGEVSPGLFCAGCDVAQGVGATPSCLALYDANLCQRVGSYVNARIEARAFAALAMGLCSLFKSRHGTGALLAWERNGPGVQFGLKVKEEGYSNVFSPVANELRMYRTKTPDNPGWDAGATGAIQTLIEEFRWAVQSGTLTEFSEETLDECLDYRYDAMGVPEHPGKKAKGDPSGANLNHGDRVVAAALAWKMVKQLGKGVPLSEQPDPEPVVGSWAWRRKIYEEADRLREQDV